MLDDNCIFCKIAAGEIPSETVYEDEQFRAILDLGPASAGHTLILPKAHFKDVQRSAMNMPRMFLRLLQSLERQ